jgi:endonuclease/exonuclease/phosphatase (EEP) superfamily protein YafD
MKKLMTLLRAVPLPDAGTVMASLILSGTLCAFMAPLLQACGSTSCWLADLASHWLWAYMVLALWLLARTDGYARKASVLTAVLVLWQLVATWTSLSPAVAHQRVFRVVQANVHVLNPSPERLLAWVRERQPDVLVVEEVSHAWRPALEAVPGYPYHYVLPRKDSFGIAVLSRHPLRQLASAVAPHPDTPSLDVIVDWHGQPVRLLAVHPMPPSIPYFHAVLDTRLAQAAETLAKDSRPALLVGDFNATPWSGGAVGLRQAGLTLASPTVPTWPTTFGPLALLPLDQVAFNRHWSVVARERGPDIGSDHFPVEVTLVPAP